MNNERRQSETYSPYDHPKTIVRVARNLRLRMSMLIVCTMTLPTLTSRITINAMSHFICGRDLRVCKYWVPLLRDQKRRAYATKATTPAASLPDCTSFGQKPIAGATSCRERGNALQ